MSGLVLTSWEILRHLVLLGADAYTNPIFQRELTRPPIWQTAAVWMSRATGVMLVVSGLTCYVSVLMVFYLKNLLILLIPALAMWALLLAITLAPTVAQERDQRTWDVLRATPFALADLLLSKASGALWWLRPVLRLLVGMMVLVAAGIGLVSLLMSSAGLNDNPLDLPPTVMCLGTLVAPATVAALFVADRMQFFVLSVLATLAASASTGNVRSAMSSALTVLFAVWLSDIAVAALLIRFRFDTGLGWDMLSVSALGPIAGYLGRLTLNQLVLAGAATLVLREGLVVALWRWTLRAAQAGE